MKKKIFSLVLILSIVSSIITPLPIMAHIKEGGPFFDGTLYYDIVTSGNKKTVEINGCSYSESGTLTIPSSINGYPVTDVYLHGYDNITYAIVPNGVTNISFNYCINLTGVELPNSLERIGGQDFTECHSLTSVVIPDGVREIGWDAFSFCYSLTSVTIPNSVTKIGEFAFDRCYNLRDVYYTGSEEEWEEIYIEEGNTCLTNQATIHYNDVQISSISLSQSSVTLQEGNRYKLSAYCFPSNAANKYVKWSSSNTSVATVDQNGNVTAKSVGQAVIQAKGGKVKSSCLLTVNNQIDYSDYEFSFSNWFDSFGYPYHYADSDVKKKNPISDYRIPLARYLEAGISPVFAELYYSSKKWNGSCYGMALASMLFYKNYLHEEKYDRYVSVPYDFSKPNSNNHVDKKLRNAIELLQCSQYRIGNFLYQTLKNSSDYMQIVDELNKKNPVLLNLTEHTILITGYSLNNDKYTFYVYDPASFISNIVWDSYSNDTTINYINPSNNGKFTIVSFIKYSYLLNDIKKYTSPVGQGLYLLSAKQRYITVITNKNTEIKNSFGNKYIILDGTINGDIENIKCIMPEEFENDGFYTIIAPADTYTITGMVDKETTTAFADDYMSVEITANGTTPITVSDDLSEITLDCSEDEKYCVKYTTFDNLFDKMTVSGVANGKVTVSFDGDKINVDGAKTVNAVATVSGVESSAEAEANGNTATIECVKGKEGTQLQIISGNVMLTEAVPLSARQQTPVPVLYCDLESGYYPDGQILSFADDDETVIYYTTDGSEPNSDTGIIYSSAININKSMTIKAIATKYGFEDSEVLTRSYTLPTVLPPVASAESGSYDDILYLDFKAGRECEIYYTTDGSEPDIYSNLFGASIVIDEDTTIKAIAIKDDVVSDVVTYEYEINSKYPFYLINTPTNQNGEPLEIENLTDTTYLNLVIKKLTTAEQSGNFVVAFYDENDRLVSLRSKKELITEEVQTVNIEVSELPTNISKMKVFMWDDFATITPLSHSESFNL